MKVIDVRCGDAAAELKKLSDCSVQCCVTSPPYWGLRDYGVDGQLGLEPTPDEYVAKMVAVFSEVRRVLREDGTLWMNLGDSYVRTGETNVPQTKDHRADYPLHLKEGSSDGRVGRSDRPGTRSNANGLKPKDLCGIPWRVAFALQADGWYLRSDIIWHKPNPMPESVTDRPTKSHEYLFLLTKNQRYYYDAEAIKEPSVDPEGSENRYKSEFGGAKADARIEQGLVTTPKGTREFNGTRNKRTVWTIPTSPYSEAHFATFPPDLIKPCIMAGTSARGCCPKCFAPWVRVVEKEKHKVSDSPRSSGNGDRNDSEDGRYQSETRTIGWEPVCECGRDDAMSLWNSNADSMNQWNELGEDEQKELISKANAPIPCTVLDPFGGSGTTGMVALELGRKAILIELNPEYIELINRRTFVTQGLSL